MPSCVACGAELEPPVRAPHTVYVKTLYRIGGQDYCRHHIVRAAAAAGVITDQQLPLPGQCPDGLPRPSVKEVAFLPVRIASPKTLPNASGCLN